jgi:sulfur carrier protein ThiS
MRVTVKLLTSMQKYHPTPESGEDSCDITLGTKATVKTLLKKLQIPDDLPKTVLVNRLFAEYGKALKEGDVISLLQPISGG